MDLSPLFSKRVRVRITRGFCYDYRSAQDWKFQYMNTSLQDNYKKGGFGFKLLPGRKASLLIIDFVRAYLSKESPLYAGVESTRESTVRLLELGRRASIPIVHTYVEYEAGGRNGGVFFRKVPALRCFERGVHPELTKFAEGLEPAAGETVICKQYASAFFGTSLSSTLTAIGVDTILIAGLSTSGCVRATAVDACQLGFIPLVVREAVGDRAREPHEASLFDLQAKYAEVISLQEAATLLSKLHA
jgi:maleamate amidohydrolase